MYYGDANIADHLIHRIGINHIPLAVDKAKGNRVPIRFHQHGAEVSVVANLAAFYRLIEIITRLAPESIDEIGETVADNALVGVVMPGQDRGGPPFLEGPLHPIAIPVKCRRIGWKMIVDNVPG